MLPLTACMQSIISFHLTYHPIASNFGMHQPIKISLALTCPIDISLGLEIWLRNILPLGWQLIPLDHFSNCCFMILLTLQTIRCPIIRGFKKEKQGKTDTWMSDPWLISSTRYQVISPTKFQIGNIVEAQMSFQVVPVRGGQHMIVVILRSLALLDSQQARVSHYNFILFAPL